MTDDLEPRLAALPAAARARLERFARAFERLHANDYAMFATTADDEAEVDTIFEATLLGLGTETARTAAWSAIEAFVDWAIAGYQRRTGAEVVLTLPTLPDAEARTRFVRTVEAAVLAIVAWDQLADEDREVLLGPFATMADQAAVVRVEPDAP